MSVLSIHSESAELADRVFERVDATGPQTGGVTPTGIEGLVATTATSPTTLTATIYTPVACLILQGAKEVVHAECRVECGAGSVVVVSHDIPVQSRIVHAAPDRPYAALILSLDVALLRTVAAEAGIAATDDEPVAQPLVAGQADAGMVAGMARLLDLGDTPEDADVLAPLIRKELHYRLLRAEAGHALRRLLSVASDASRVSLAIDHIRQHLAEPMSVADLAEVCGVSASTLHADFKRVTSTTPLQYQKDLRLLQAHQLLSAGGATATEAASSVGYVSPSQFSREYSRRFGQPPRDTIVGKDPFAVAN
jgi:AraC-like DNA-binding protein